MRIASPAVNHRSVAASSNYFPREGCEVLRSSCTSLGLSVCLCACISQKSHVETSRNSLQAYVLIVAVARSSFDDNAIRYVLPILWMTLCFHIIGQIQIQACRLRDNELFPVTRQVSPLKCASGAKSATVDCQQPST